MLCKTKEGYFVLALPSSIIRRNDNPPIFSKYNPYTIYNIKIWLKRNNITSLELLSSEYINSSSKLQWLCRNCNKEFSASWNDVLQGKRYCNFCVKSKRWDNITDYNKLVQEKCDKLGYELIPNQNITRGNTCFKYICKRHRDYGIQESYPSNFVTSYGNGGCYQCAIEKRSVAKRKSKSFFKNITEKAGMIFVDVEYSDNDRTKIIYKCPKHIEKGIFKTYISNMKKNDGKCPCCVGRFRSKEDLQKEVDNLKSNITILNYTDYSSDIFVECNICGYKWNTSGVNLTQGHRCPNCCKSKFELEVQYILDKYDFEYIPQYWFDDCRDINPLPFDFYLIDKNILIEADGEGHYIPIRRSSNMTEDDAKEHLKIVKYHDNIKTEYCKKNNIQLIRIPYWERDNLEDYIIKNIA